MRLYFHRTLLAIATLVLPLHADPSVLVSLNNISGRIRSQNPDLVAARLRIQEALGRMHQSGRLSNPELETTWGQNSNFREGSFEVEISQRFPLTNRLRLEKEISLTELKSSEAEVREIERQLVGQARAVVVKVLAIHKHRSLLQQQSQLLNEFAQSLADATQRGEVPALDMGLAKLEAASLSISLHQLDVAAMALVGELKPLLGMHPGETLTIDGSLPEVTIPSTAARSTRPDLQAAKLLALAAAKDVALEQAKRYDDVEGGIFAAAERTEDAPQGYENEATVGVRFKIALPFWNHNEGAIREAKAKRLRKESEVIALDRGIRLEAETARAEMQQCLKMITEIDNTLIPLANEQTRLAEDAYRSGQGEIPSVLRSREKRLQLFAAKLDALREFHLARVRHETALGGSL